MQSKQESGGQAQGVAAHTEEPLCYDGFRRGGAAPLPWPILSLRPCGFSPFSSRTQTKPHFQRLSLEDLGL